MVTENNGEGELLWPLKVQSHTREFNTWFMLLKKSGQRKKIVNHPRNNLGYEIAAVMQMKFLNIPVRLMVLADSHYNDAFLTKAELLPILYLQSNAGSETAAAPLDHQNHCLFPSAQLHIQ